ncbi:hypothetical protein BCR43DRAFT_509600 [Syncephalastrum racemosum]|uniref:Extracellular membrane protein CFEM domain-containing protein n=1 Tax=Syncephalastrum racemosum TaxID=13706 RepID=A0A1X2HS54_SYNRA|nr:hypothetical protein BCR43DRAFT_509600 [Syncephalastrum racemosum]
MTIQSIPSFLVAIWSLVLGLHAFAALAQEQQPQASTPSASSCSVPKVFAQCLTNQDNYIRGCTGQDYTCLCKWNTVKLSCWDSCPNEPGRQAQNGIKETYCTISGIAQNATSPSTTHSPAASSLSPTASESSASASNQGSHAVQNGASGSVDRTSTAFAFAGFFFVALVWETL